MGHSCHTLADRKRIGSLGGKARARNLTQDRMEEIGRQGGSATLAKYGHAYFRHINRYVQRKQARATNGK
jgi:general stress protein YciG